MAISLSKAKSLCTATELALVEVSGPKNIGELSAAQLRQKVSRARKLVDKWRDQADSQRRAAQSKQGSRQTSAAGRSAEKAELFAEVLKRFETRLAKTEAKAPATTGSKGKESPRKVRNREHRATRASVRGDLAESRRELSVKKPVRRKAATKAPAASVDIEAENVAGTIAPVPTTKKAVRPKRPAPTEAHPTITHAPGLVVTKGKQRRAKTAAKQNRLEAAGIKRMQKHASARNKRNQAKRDSR